LKSESEGGKTSFGIMAEQRTLTANYKYTQLHMTWQPSEKFTMGQKYCESGPCDLEEGFLVKDGDWHTHVLTVHTRPGCVDSGAA